MWAYYKIPNNLLRSPNDAKNGIAGQNGDDVCGKERHGRRSDWQKGIAGRKRCEIHRRCDLETASAVQASRIAKPALKQRI